MVDLNITAKPFEPFIFVYKMLGWAGYYKLIDKPKYKHLESLHNVYRILIFVFVLIYNLQHILFFVKSFEVDKDQSFEALMIEIPQVNLVVKLIAVNMGNKKLDRLREIMNDPIFAAKSAKDEEFLRNNRDTFRRVTKTILITISCSVVLWISTAVFTRRKDKNAVVPIYVPFSTDSWTGFGFTILLEHGPICWIGFAHLALDILIGCHYSQATVQLKIIRHNLEHLCDSTKEAGYILVENKRIYKYIDDLDVGIKERFEHYVDRYAKVIWFLNEINSIFNIAVSVQFLTTSSPICLIIYKLSLAEEPVEIIFLVVYFVILQLQVILYCFFGELLRDESKFVMDSAYLSDWLSLSPKFRKQLLIAMTRWSIPIIPLAAGVVPLSLNTFILLARAAFNLLTVLKTTNGN